MGGAVERNRYEAYTNKPPAFRCRRTLLYLVGKRNVTVNRPPIPSGPLSGLEIQ